MPLNYCYGVSWHFFNLSCNSATCFSTKFFLCTRNTTWQTVSLFWQHNNTAVYLKFCIIKEINLHIIKLLHLSHSGLSLVKTVSGEIACFLCGKKKKKALHLQSKKKKKNVKNYQSIEIMPLKDLLFKEYPCYHFSLWWHWVSFSFPGQNKFWFSKIFYWMKQIDSKGMILVKFSLFHIPSGL